jgi:RNA polymerase sigma-70 factor, ECF subfamily
VLAATVRVTRDLDTAEEAVQDAYVRALETWPDDGVPERPGAWLTTVARRRALNLLRRGRTLQTKLPLLLEPAEAEPPDRDADAIPDDRLRLVFTCCHPSLSLEAQVALTLRLVCGVATPDVAHAFVVSEATMAARITRAKKKIEAARIRYAVPAPDELPARVDAALTVIHLLYTTGHTAHAGDRLVRDELTIRALDLARMLRLLLPSDREAAGLLALLLVHEARRPTRTDPGGQMVRLAEQDRSAWDRERIAEADRLVVGALRAGPPGRFLLQAAIAALHAQAPSYEETDWPQILTLYDELLRIWPSEVVALNRAVALSMVAGPEDALAAVEALERDGRLAGYRYLPATKADLLHRLGRDAEAASAYEAALALTDNAVERAFLEGRLVDSRAMQPVSVLSDGTIRRMVEEGRIRIDPWDPGMIQPASIDLRLGNSFRVFHNHRARAIDLRDPPRNLTEQIVLGPDEPFVVHPGEFVLARTEEHVVLPDDVVARIEGKSSLGRLGLIVHATAGFVDPGFSGTLTLEVTNLTRIPIELWPGLPIAQLSFMALDAPAERPYGHPDLGSHYHGQVDATESRYEGGPARRGPGR